MLKHLAKLTADHRRSNGPLRCSARLLARLLQRRRRAERQLRQHPELDACRPWSAVTELPHDVSQHSNGVSEDMNTRTLNTMFNGPLLLGVLIGAGALLHSLPSSASDLANVRIINEGGEEGVEVDLDQLAVGESRQLTSSSGKPAVVTRSEDGLTIEIAGKTTEVKLAASGGPQVWHADLGDGKVKIIELDDETVHEGDAAHREHKIVMLHKDGEAAGDHEQELELLLADADIDASVEPGKDKIIVTRKVIKEVQQD